MLHPLAMRVHFRKLSVVRPDGTVVPLVRSERTLFQSTEPAPPPAPPSWLASYLVGGLLIGGLAFGLAVAAPVSAPAQMAFLALVWIWLLVSGTAGVVVSGLWAFTNHAAAYRNENVLQLTVLALPLLWFVTRLVFGSRTAARPALLLGGAMVALSLAGLLLKPLPQFFQVNEAIIALALPAHAGIGAAIWRLSRPQGRLPTRRAPARASG
jgi:hypothetical protein